MKIGIEQSKKWIAVKIIILIYLIVFNIFYIAILMIKYKIIEIYFTFDSIRIQSEYALSIFPYAINLFSALFVLSFYDEMKSVYASLSVPSLKDDEINLV